MYRNLTCPVCGKEFVTDKNAAKYCSSACRRKANAPAPKGEEREFNCMWCSASFVSDRQKKYCSKECRVASYKKIYVRKPRLKPELTLSQVAMLSRKAGLSYGQYVQLNSL